MAELKESSRAAFHLIINIELMRLKPVNICLQKNIVSRVKILKVVFPGQTGKSCRSLVWG